jgi:hypothetical protein
MGLMYVQLASPVVFPFLLVLNQMRTRRDDGRIHAGVFTLGWAACFFLAAADPWGILDWWMD